MFKNFLFRGKKTDKYGGEWITSSLIQVYPKGILLGELDEAIASKANDGLPEILKDYVRWYPIKPETLCRATEFKTFERDSGTKEPVFDKDIVELTLPGGTKFRYAVWYMEEGSSFVAVPWSEEAVNGDDAMFVNYPVNFKDEINWDKFAFMMNDPYGDLQSVKVIGNYIDNPELFLTKTTKTLVSKPNEWEF